jgi:hypothetical protein
MKHISITYLFNFNFSNSSGNYLISFMQNRGMHSICQWTRYTCILLDHRLHDVYWMKWKCFISASFFFPKRHLCPIHHLHAAAAVSMLSSRTHASDPLTISSKLDGYEYVLSHSIVSYNLLPLSRAPVPVNTNCVSRNKKRTNGALWDYSKCKQIHDQILAEWSRSAAQGS